VTTTSRNRTSQHSWNRSEQGMQAFSATRLLALWERCGVLSGRRRGAVLASAASVEDSAADPQASTLGERNAALLALREAWFGSRLALTAACPHCREQLELDLDLSDLPRGEANHGELVTELDGWHVRFRVPRLADLEQLPRSSGGDAQALLEYCALDIRYEGLPRSAAELPPAVLAHIDAALLAADPRGLGSLDVGCSACERAFSAPLDIASVLWHELDAWAHHTLAEVHTLASAYGWREADVLALSAQRRFLYLQLAAGR